MTGKVVIHWFQQDFRLTDNPALYHATKLGPVLPLYLLDETEPKHLQAGAASRVWLHHALHALNNSLDQALFVFKGAPITILDTLITRYSITDLCWNYRYEPWYENRDTKLITWLKSRGIEIHLFNGTLLWKPGSIRKQDGQSYKVFTPFYRNGCLAAESPRSPLPSVGALAQWIKPTNRLDIHSLALLPQTRWDKTILSHWQIGESAAREKLKTFLKEPVHRYKVGRDLPAAAHTSRLSTHLHFGELSVNQVWHAIQQLPQDMNTDCFLSQLGWREFSYNLLIHNPNLSTENLQSKFDAFPWSENQNHFQAWQTGKTGIPMVDAGMRELWQTGYMHNRLRMIVGSFLVKNLRLDWRRGERWFWDCLVDANLANNSASWQWVAGCGADAAPYFRVFNPIMQGKKFDPGGHYIKRFVPELRTLPLKYLFSPWEAPSSILDEAGIQLGETYPRPIVDLKKSRLDALDAFSSLKTLR